MFPFPFPFLSLLPYHWKRLPSPSLPLLPSENVSFWFSSNLFSLITFWLQALLRNGEGQRTRAGRRREVKRRRRRKGRKVRCVQSKSRTKLSLLRLSFTITPKIMTRKRIVVLRLTRLRHRIPPQGKAREGIGVAREGERGGEEGLTQGEKE